MEADYPAAHSMDTQWFAVDRDGYVAIFSSYEAGAVPLDAHEEDSWTMAERLRETRQPTAWKYDLAPGRAPGVVGKARHRPVDERDLDPLTSLVMFLRSLDPVQDALAGGLCREVPSTEGFAVIWERLPKTLFHALHSGNHCFHCRWELEDEDGPDNPSRAWAYAYEHLYDNWASGAYGRESQPRRPLHLDELPPELREQVGRFRLESLSFRETPYIQPVDHALCKSWQRSALALDGRTIGPIPGSEDEYREWYEYWAERHWEGWEHFEIRPPGNTPSGADDR
jgi:hypothetical protein